MARDNLSPEKAQSRIDSQMSIEKKRELADIVIDNSGEKDHTKRQAAEAIKKLMPNRVVNWLIWGALMAPAAVLYGMLTFYKSARSGLAKRDAKKSLRVADKNERKQS